MARNTLVVPEKKEKIEKIKKKYDNLSMSDKTAKQIKTLEITNSILLTATVVSGIVTIIDIFTPDAIFLVDELALGAITGLLKASSSIVENKIADLASNGTTRATSEEVNKIADEIQNVRNTLSNSKSK